MKTPILGGSYVARSVNAADNRMVNLYPEMIPEGGKEPAFLQRCPAFSSYATFGTGPVRGMWVLNELYVVSGGTLYQYASGSTTNIGAVAGTGPVSMADNGTQLFIATNLGTSYIYNRDTTVFAQITDVDFPGAVTVGYLDGFFVFTPGSAGSGVQTVWVSDLLDGTSVQPLNFASAEASPDGVAAVLVSNGELWVFGDTTTEVWYNPGNAGFPFAPIQGAFMEVGCAATHSVAKMNNTVFWVGNDRLGQGVVYMAKGYSPERISTHALEWAIQQYYQQTGGLGDLIAYTYQQGGHSFYVLSFPQYNNTTWVYDVLTGMWHERGEWDGANDYYTRDRAQCHAFYGGAHLVGDYANGDVYSLIPTWDSTVWASTAPNSLKWLRSWRALATGQNTLKRTAHHSLQLDCETGVGNEFDPGQNPTVTLRWSDDGGHTWSNERTANLGASGEYGTRVIWRRLGMTQKLRDRVYEVSGTDPVNIFINGAELLMSPTDA